MTRRSPALAATLIVAGSLSGASAARADDAKAACSQAYDATQAERTSGKLGAARQSAAVCTDLSCPDFIRRDCGKWLEQIDAAQPSLVLRVRRAGRDVAAVEVDLDGQKWLDRLDGRAEPIDPGHHVLRISSEGTTIDRTLLVVEGEKNRLVDVDFGGPPVQAAPRSGPRGPWIVGGVGVAALAAGGVMTGVLVHEKALNEQGCPGSTCTAAGRSAGETGRVVGPITTASFVVGGVGVAAGALWLLISGRRRAATNTGAAPASAASRGFVFPLSF